MNKIAKIALGAVVVLGLGTTTLSADAGKGQKYYKKKLQKPCGMNGADFAKKHTQGEWEEINEAGKLGAEIKKECPSVKDKAIKDKYLKHYYDFFYNFASDSGNVPSC